MEFSKRVLNMQASPIRKLIPYAEQAKKMGKTVLHLNIGQPDLETPKAFFDYIEKHNPEIISYTHSAGLIELREAFSKYYKDNNIPFTPEEIIVTNGGSEAIIFALGAIADPGDEIIVIEPFYANYKGFAEMINVKLVPVRALPETGYAVPSINEFEAVLSNRTKGIIFSNPSNPTGAVYSEEELKTIVEFAKKHDLYIISDEVYREFTFDGTKHISTMAFGEYNRTIVVDSISKRYSACGARVGVFATKNRELYNQVMKMAQSRLCPPMIAQLGTIGLLEMDKSYIESVYKEYDKRRLAVYEELSKIEGAVFEKPKGAFYVSVKLPVDNSEKFVKWLLTDFSIENTTVMVAPLNGFYATPNTGMQEIRIAYVLNSEKLRFATKILAEAVKVYNNGRVIS
ncbi:aspartate aminotransferase [Marinitoga hydrogenitolerans DSM 16785]|uniref:Aminotransferase n=1 Tax=Marinitoga hydrogenitolerans (strain DSM 16785 / JCM 12826 / AT1271) TaxID=1122195 RepID=A0A1M4WKA5_MARH1|nr:pyridoxal phosphate-dependent aminotransferase [Marinitoga hydrogenitolerans]SHE81731.1 aspartate aminotransferase [Marinitoga hydrogenitolerans DSM 16785]